MKNYEAILNTKEGKLGGECKDGIYRFLGVHYAESTSGENRFQPPRPLKPWEGVRPATSYGPFCYQTDTPRMEDKEVTSTNIPALYGKVLTGNTDLSKNIQSEDCLTLNIWTAGLRDGKKRPIMVWLHGGGYITGGAQADWHDGWNMANNHNVVFVSVNHRLGMFGYLYLCQLSDKFKDSANLGHQDMSAALHWLQDNAEEFGGDPDNILVFGQSGGGGKVAGMMAMPANKGVVKKAVIQSGGFGCGSPEQGTAMAKQLLDHLGIPYDEPEKLLDYTAEDLIAASRAINKTRTVGTYFVCNPVMDGKVIAYDPFDGAEGSEFSKDIALMTGCTRDDQKLAALFNPPVFDYTFEELPERIAALGYTAEETNEIIALYKKYLPEDADAGDYYTSLLNDLRNFDAIEKRAFSRAKVGAETYHYIFCNECTVPKMKAIHGVDVPFVMDNACYAPAMWDAETRVGAFKLSTAASSAWAAFARTGNPSNPYMPAWKPYNAETRYTMLVNYESELVSDFRKEVREFLAKTNPPRTNRLY